MAFSSLALVCLVLLAPGVDQEAEHPVTLPVDTDAAKCLECHGEKAQGRHVHTAVSAMGCTACHQVVTKNDTTYINLVSPPAELCGTCHEISKDPVVHQAYAQKECLVCHDPHASDFTAQLRARVNNLCLTCHLERVVEKPVDVFGIKTILVNDFNLIPKLMLDPTLHVGHPYVDHPVNGGLDPLRKGEDFECLSCHLPHTAPFDNLLPAAWGKTEVCDQCHAAAKALKQASTSKPAQAANSGQTPKVNQIAKPNTPAKPDKPENLEKQ